MNLFWRWLAIVASAVGIASCAEPQKPQAFTKAAPSGSSFNQIGKVTFYKGEPCTSQIMFAFHGATSDAIAMAAPMYETKILADAAHRNRTVHVSGKWRRGKQSGCAYVEVSRVQMEKSFWQRD